MQTAGVHYSESYAPVCMWSTVRLLLILGLIAKLPTIQVDYTNAFAQAKLFELVYIDIPTGFIKDPEDVLLLLKSL